MHTPLEWWHHEKERTPKGAPYTHSVVGWLLRCVLRQQCRHLERVTHGGFTLPGLKQQRTSMVEP